MVKNFKEKKNLLKPDKPPSPKKPSKPLSKTTPSPKTLPSKSLSKTQSKPLSKTPSKPLSKTQSKSLSKTPSKSSSKPLSKNPSKELSKTKSKEKSKLVVVENKLKKTNSKKLKSCLLNKHRKKHSQKVMFNPKITVINYNKNDNPNHYMLNKKIQYLIKECDLSHIKIFQLINKHSSNKILPSLNSLERDTPVKVYNMKHNWWEDTGPIVFFNKLYNNKEFLNDFIKIFDYYVKKTCHVGESKPLVINSNSFKIKFERITRNV